MTSHQIGLAAYYSIVGSFGTNGRGLPVFPVRTILVGSSYVPLDVEETYIHDEDTITTGGASNTIYSAAADVTPYITRIAIACSDNRPFYLTDGVTGDFICLPNGNGIWEFPYGLKTDENKDIVLSWLGGAAAGNYFFDMWYIPMDT